MEHRGAVGRGADAGGAIGSRPDLRDSPSSVTIRAVFAARQRCGPRIHLLEGLEVDIRADGHLDLPDKILETMEIVVASIHSAFAQSKAQITTRLLGAIRNRHVDVIGHPSGRLLGEPEAYPVDWDEVFTAAARHGVALEINAFPNRLDLNDTLAREAHRRGGPWSSTPTPTRSSTSP